MQGFLRDTVAAVVAFGVAVVVVRLIGKKEISQMTMWELVSAIALGSFTANIVAVKDTPIWEGIWVVVLWGALTIAVDWAALRSKRFRVALASTPVVLVANGQLQEDAMRQQRITLELLRSQLRTKNVFSLSDVEFAILEPSGKISVQLKSQKRPATPADLHVSTAYSGPATALIEDSQVLTENLQHVGLSREWLLGELARQGIADTSEVFYAELNTDGSLYIDRRQMH
jgi:uncharacterized membrane protein YcaP (DUF421 family)